MPGTLPTSPRTPESAYAKRRRFFVASILSVTAAAFISVGFALSGSPLTGAVMPVMWFNASIQWCYWMILCERCRNLEQAQ
jgi:hypothetical protein